MLRIDAAHGLRGWQWLFIIEGLPAVLLAPVVLRGLTERPADATWLTADERDWLTREMAEEQEHTPGVHVTLRTAARSGRLWALSALYVCIVMALLRRELLAAADRASHWRSELGHGETTRKQ